MKKIHIELTPIAFDPEQLRLGYTTGIVENRICSVLGLPARMIGFNNPGEDEGVGGIGALPVIPPPAKVGGNVCEVPRG